MGRIATFHPVSWAIAVGLAALSLSETAYTEDEKGVKTYPADVVKYLDRVNHAGQQRFSYRTDYPGGFTKWRADARLELKELIGLDKIASQAPGFEAKVKLDPPEVLDSYTRQRGVIETEPSVRIPFWLLKPKGKGPFPLGIFPHGHGANGHDITAGVFEEADRAESPREGRDVAVQAVERGFLAIAPATRGFAADGVPDLHGRHGERDCRSHLVHCLLAGRTAIGERVWDMQRILDWATTLPSVDSSRVLMMGNYGGGIVALYASACDVRITVAVPSRSFTLLTSPAGHIHHCDCNLVPGLLEFGDLPDVAGLTAPRAFLVVSGVNDRLHLQEDVKRAVARVRTIYEAAGADGQFEHRWGQEGHRFYSDLMWPFVLAATNP